MADNKKQKFLNELHCIAMATLSDREEFIKRMLERIEKIDGALPLVWLANDIQRFIGDLYINVYVHKICEDNLDMLSLYYSETVYYLNKLFNKRLKDEQNSNNEMV